MALRYSTQQGGLVYEVKHLYYEGHRRLNCACSMKKADRRNANIFAVLLCMFVVIIDQATKFSVLAFLPKNSVLSVFKGFNIVLTFNFGTSFGLLTPSTVMQFYMLVIMTILCIVFLIFLSFKMTNIFERMLCSLIIGGAIGNLCDRFFHGAVVDFIDLYYKDWHWPAFNVADSFISVSAVFLLVYSIFTPKYRDF
ncbi:MAG: signal peptidase II [Holosporales bacterium]|nr:signal peptidase II [Holosporales bacterium]